MKTALETKEALIAAADEHAEAIVKLLKKLGYKYVSVQATTAVRIHTNADGNRDNTGLTIVARYE